MRCTGSQVCIRGDFNIGHVYAVASVQVPPWNFDMHSPVIYDYPENLLPAGLRDRTIFGQSGECFRKTEMKERKSHSGPRGILSNP